VIGCTSLSFDNISHACLDLRKNTYIYNPIFQHPVTSSYRTKLLAAEVLGKISNVCKFLVFEGIDLISTRAGKNALFWPSRLTFGLLDSTLPCLRFCALFLDQHFALLLSCSLNISHACLDLRKNTYIIQYSSTL
jgi:hypothetical protein